MKNLEKRIDELLAIFDISNIGNTKVLTMSTGQIVRVIICKALINNPKLLLLDECTVGLDPVIAQKTRQLLKEYQKKYNTTILFTSHNLFEVEMLCDRIAIITNGRILAMGTPKEIRSLMPSRSIKIDALGAAPLKAALAQFGLDITSAKKNTIIFRTESDKVLPKVLNHLVREGFDIIDVKVRKPTLEDVFIHMTNGGEQIPMAYGGGQ